MSKMSHKSEEKEVKYVPVQVLDQLHQDEEEFQIDIIKILATIRSNRKKIYIAIAVIVSMMILNHFMSPRLYTSTAIILPEAQLSTTPGGGISMLARQFGILPQTGGTNDGLSANLYPTILTSTDLLLELTKLKVEVSRVKSEVTLQEYFIEHQERSIFIDLTIGLPGTIIRTIRRFTSGASSTATQVDDTEQQNESGVQYLSSRETGAIRRLSSSIAVQPNLTEGYLTISVTTQDPEISAQIANRLIELLTEFVISYRTEKAQKDLDFIEKRHEEAKIRFEEIQSALATFRDRNRGTLTASAQMEQQNLINEYTLASNIHTALTEQLEQANIKLQQDTPVVNVLERPKFPLIDNSESIITLFIYSLILGAFFGLIWIFVIPFLTNTLINVRNYKLNKDI